MRDSTHPPKPGDTFRQVGTPDTAPRLHVEAILGEGETSFGARGTIVRAVEGGRWMVWGPDQVYETIRFAGEPIPEPPPLGPRRMP